MSKNDINKDELCSNWWPSSNHLIKNKIDKGMPHPMCRMCANWLPDIEDLGVIINVKGCGNNWSKEKNTKK
jgi:hypothetical protein